MGYGHKLTWRKVLEGKGRYEQLIGSASAVRGASDEVIRKANIGVWQSVARDTQTGNIYDPMPVAVPRR